MSTTSTASIGSLPPELLEAILILAAAPHQATRASRNTNLLAFALVHSAFNVAATRLLYTDLSLDFRLSTAAQLTRTLDGKPALAKAVRSLDVIYASAFSWVNAWIRAREDTWTEEDEQREWMNRPPLDEGEEDEETAWSYFERKKTQWATMAMFASVDAAWLRGQAGRAQGVNALFHLIGRFPLLQRFAVEDLRADDIDAVTPTLATQAVLQNLSAFGCVASDWRAPQSLLAMLNHAPRLAKLELDTIQLFHSSRAGQPFRFPIQLAFPRLTHLVAGFAPGASGSESANGADLILALIKLAESTLTHVSLGPYFPASATCQATVLQLPHLVSLTYHRDPALGLRPEGDILSPHSLIPHLLKSRLVFLDIRGFFRPPQALNNYFDLADFFNALPATLEVLVTSFPAPASRSPVFEGILEELLEQKERLVNLRRATVVMPMRVTVEMEEAVASLEGATGLVELVQEVESA